MKKSIFGLDTIELTKRYKQHKADLQHIKDSAYLDFKEKCFQTRKKQLHFTNSLRANEVNFVHELTIAELGGIPNE